VAFSFAVSILIPILVGIVITGLIVYLIAKKKLPADFYWAIFIGGTIGNLIDRIRIGKVIDFISIGNFPVFNLADTYITISAIFIFYSLIKKND
jgi:signal peptidase II